MSSPLLKRARTMTVTLETLLSPLKNATIVSKHNVQNLNNEFLGTHDGSFHCDEALALAMLKMLPQFQSATILRTRDTELLKECGVVVDVGAEYSPENKRFDHHQRGFTEVLEGYQTKLSSAGLVYRHYGKEILAHLASQLMDLTVEEVPTPLLDALYKRMYTGFVEHIDGIDNGVSIADGELRYQITTSLSSRVGQLSPSWNEPQGPDVMNARFSEALLLTGTEFLRSVQGLVNSWWPARSLVANAMNERFDIHPSGKIIMMECACPWKDHLFEIEKEQSIAGEILYALYLDSNDGSTRIQAVPVEPSSFQSRKKLPDAWCGLRNEELSAASGVEGGIFIHASGFIGGAKTKDAAIAMAIKAVEM